MLEKKLESFKLLVHLPDLLVSPGGPTGTGNDSLVRHVVSELSPGKQRILFCFF